MQQHPVFRKYTREWLHDVTGYSELYLYRVASGRVPVSKPFIVRVSLMLNEPAEKLFLREATSVPSSDPNHK